MTLAEKQTMKIEELQKIIGLKFKNPKLCEQAFIHRSYLNEVRKKRLKSNERLEFLGDSVLSLLTSKFLYDRFPEEGEGNLTNMRSSLVCTKTLSKISAKLSLGKFLVMSKGEVKEGGRNNPSILADTFEALIGAIYLDQGIARAKEFIEKFLFSTSEKILRNQSLKDPKSLLQEKIQERIPVSPSYKVLKEEGPDHAKKFSVGVFLEKKLLGQGEGRNKQEAEESAAKYALKNWHKLKIWP